MLIHNEFWVGFLLKRLGPTVLVISALVLVHISSIYRTLMEDPHQVLFWTQMIAYDYFKEA